MGLRRVTGLLNNEAMQKYKEVNEAYSEASKIFQNIRLLCSHRDATDEEQARLFRATKEYSKASKIFHAGKIEWQRSMRAMRTSQRELPDEDFIEMYEDTSMKAVRDYEKRNAVVNAAGLYSEEDIKKMQDSIDEAKKQLSGDKKPAATETEDLAPLIEDEEHQDIQNEPVLDKPVFKKTKIDPTLDDFSIFEKGVA